MKFGTNIASGGAAGTMSLLFVYSLDYARTRLANDSKGKGGERQFNGLIDVYTKTLKSDGIQGLYRGFAISAVGIFIYRGMYFGLFDTLKPVLLGDGNSPTQEEGEGDVGVISEKNRLQGVEQTKVHATVDEDTNSGDSEASVESLDTVRLQGLGVDVNETVELSLASLALGVIGQPGPGVVQGVDEG